MSYMSNKFTHIFKKERKKKNKKKHKKGEKNKNVILYTACHHKFPHGA